MYTRTLWLPLTVWLLVYWLFLGLICECYIVGGAEFAINLNYSLQPSLVVPGGRNYGGLPQCYFGYSWLIDFFALLLLEHQFGVFSRSNISCQNLWSKGYWLALLHGFPKWCGCYLHLQIELVLFIICISCSLNEGSLFLDGLGFCRFSYMLSFIPRVCS